MDLSIVIPALNEGPNLAELLPELVEVVGSLGVRWEILVITRDPDNLTRQVAAKTGATVVEQRKPGYGGALEAAFETSSGEYILTMDADLSHRPVFIADLWRERFDADVIIASRYVAGGRAEMPKGRYLLSRVLNGLYGIGLNLPIRDLSSGYRLYRASSIPPGPLATNFDVLPELLVHAYTAGAVVKEVPFAYSPRQHGSSHARILKFGMDYLRTFGSLWRLRNSRGRFRPA